MKRSLDGEFTAGGLIDAIFPILLIPFVQRFGDCCRIHPYIAEQNSTFRPNIHDMTLQFELYWKYIEMFSLKKAF